MNRTSALKINVGFLIHEEIGVDRDFSFDFPSLEVEDDILLRDVHVDLNLSKTQLGLIATMQLQGNAGLECSRCLDSISHRIETEFTELFASGKKDVSESAILIPEDHTIDFYPILQEYVVLAQPSHSLCKEDCQGLCVECGVNLNKEDCGHEQISIDPRFAGLKDLLQDKEEE